MKYTGFLDVFFQPSNNAMNYNGFSASGTKCIQQAIVFLQSFLLGRRIHLFHRRYSALIMTPVVVHARREPLCLRACK